MFQLASRRPSNSLTVTDMGSWIATSKLRSMLLAPIDADTGTDSIYDLDRSDKLDRVLRSVRATSAFLKYLDRNGKGCFLILHLDIIHYKRTKNQNLLQQALKNIRTTLSLLMEGIFYL